MRHKGWGFSKCRLRDSRDRLNCKEIAIIGLHLEDSVLFEKLPQAGRPIGQPRTLCTSPRASARADGFPDVYALEHRENQGTVQTGLRCKSLCSGSCISMISMDASQAAFLVIAVSSNLRPPRTICWAEPVLILKAHVLALPAVRWVLDVSFLSGGLAVLTSSCGFLGRCYQRISHVLSYFVCISSTSTLGNTNTIRMYYINSAHDFSLLHTLLALFFASALSH